MSCSGYTCSGHPSAADLERDRAAAAIRVRAKRRIRLALGDVQLAGVYPLAPLLRAVLELERLRRAAVC